MSHSSSSDGIDIFVSHAEADRQIAEDVVTLLERRGLRCWVAFRDIVPGAAYEEAIVEAIHAARVMVVISSAAANRSRHVEREIRTASEVERTTVVLRLDQTPLSSVPLYHLGGSQWVDASRPPLDQRLRELAEAVSRALASQSVEKEEESTAADPGSATAEKLTNPEKMQSSTARLLRMAGGPVVALAIVYLILNTLKPLEKSPEEPSEDRSKQERVRGDNEGTLGDLRRWLSAAERDCQGRGESWTVRIRGREFLVQGIYSGSHFLLDVPLVTQGQRYEELQVRTALRSARVTFSLSDVPSLQAELNSSADSVGFVVGKVLRAVGVTDSTTLLNEPNC